MVGALKNHNFSIYEIISSNGMRFKLTISEIAGLYVFNK